MGVKSQRIAPGAAKVAVSARVDKALVAKLDQMAEWDERGRSNLIAFAIRDYIEDNYDELKPRARNNR